MGLARTPPQVVYPRSSFITPTPQGVGTQSQSRQPPALSSDRVPPQNISSVEPPVTPVKSDKTPTAPPRLSATRLEYPPLSAQSSGELGFTPLSARVTPVPSARPIITVSENGPLNAHINSLNKQLAELEAQKKDLNVRLADSDKKLENEIIRRERTIKDLAAQHDQEKQEWKEVYDAVCSPEIYIILFFNLSTVK
jgi:DNA repair exonuclease SbcCD ATPase subunit